MAKNNAPQTPENYIKNGNARKLPLHECWINTDHLEAGMASVIVTRKHKSGNYTGASFLVDMYCLGIKDSMYFFNIDEEDYQTKVLRKKDILEKVEYNYAHNLVFGADIYAEELGLSPHKTFAITQHILEEDTEEIELIYFEFGKDGKPYLFIRNGENRDKELKILERTQGEGNFNFTQEVEGFDDYDYLENDDDDDDGDDDFEEALKAEEILNDNDALYFVESEDIEPLQKLMLLDSLEEGDEKEIAIKNYLGNEDNIPSFLIHKSADVAYAKQFPNHHASVDAINIAFPLASCKMDEYYHYPVNLKAIETDYAIYFTELSEKFAKTKSTFKKLHDAIIDKLKLKYKDDEALYVYLIYDYMKLDENDSEKEFEYYANYYQKFQKSIHAQASYLSLYIDIHVEKKGEDLDPNPQEIISELPFQILENTSFSLLYPNIITPHLCEVAAFLFLQGVNYLANNKLNYAEACLREMVTLRVKSTHYFSQLRHLLSSLKSDLIEKTTDTESHLKIVR